MELTRTQLRRQQRKHSRQCLYVGALQRASHRLEGIKLEELVESNELAIIARSIATHRADCVAVQHPVHFAAVSNCQSMQGKHKSCRTYKQHKRLHQEANLIKHEVDISESGGPSGQETAPPPPPPFEQVELHGAAWCHDLEIAFTSTLNPKAPAFVPFEGASSKLYFCEAQCPDCGMIHQQGSVCHWCGGLAETIALETDFHSACGEQSVQDDELLLIESQYKQFLWGHFVQRALYTDKFRRIASGQLKLVFFLWQRIFRVEQTVTGERVDDSANAPCRFDKDHANYGDSFQAFVSHLCAFISAGLQLTSNFLLRSMVILPYVMPNLVTLERVSAWIYAILSSMMCVSSQLLQSVWNRGSGISIADFKHRGEGLCNGIVLGQGPDEARNAYSGNAEPKPDTLEDCDDSNTGIAEPKASSGSWVDSSAANLSKRAKRKLKERKQKEDDDYVRQVEERFEVLNYLVLDGSLTQEMISQLRIKAEAEHNSVDKQACDLLLL